MAWEWLTSAGTVVGASITAGLGGWLGGRRSRKELEAQHRFERERALTEHSRSRIDDAISALRFLRRHASKVADAQLGDRDANWQDGNEYYERLAHAIPYLLDTGTRHDIELVYDVLADAWVMERYSGAGRAHGTVWRACDEGLLTLGRYLRSEPWIGSAELDRLRAAHADTIAIQEEVYEQQVMEHRRAQRAQAAKQPESSMAGGTIADELAAGDQAASEGQP